MPREPADEGLPPIHRAELALSRCGHRLRQAQNRSAQSTKQGHLRDALDSALVLVNEICYAGGWPTPDQLADYTPPKED